MNNLSLKILQFAQLTQKTAKQSQFPSLVVGPVVLETYCIIEIG